MRTGSGSLVCAVGQRSCRTREREPSQPMSIEPVAEVPSVNAAVTLEEEEVVSKESIVLFHYPQRQLSSRSQLSTSLW